MPTSTIVLRDSDKRASVDRASIVRPIQLNTRWSHIRMGVRMVGLGPGAAAPSIEFAMGFCSGTSSVYGEESTTHFVGMSTGKPNWLYNSGRFNPSLYPTKKVQSKVTTGTALATSSPVTWMFIGVGASFNYPSFLFVDLFYGSPNYSIKAYYQNAVHGELLTSSQFLAEMAKITPNAQYHVLSAPQTLAVDEAADGVINAVQIYLKDENGAVSMEIFDVAWALLA